MPKKETKVTVVVKDGYVQAAFATQSDMLVDVIDRDALEQDGLTSADSAMEVAHQTRDMHEVYSN